MLLKGGLRPEIADYMIENCIGVLPLPLGLGLGFKINQKPYIIPMAVEEPSVIAACSAIGKLISEKGTGFLCSSTAPVMIAQIQVVEVADSKDAVYRVKAAKREIVKHANMYCENMVKRGGGVEDIRVRSLGDQMLVVELLVNVCDSMGANVVNTIAEQTSPYVLEVIGQGRIALRILSNLCTERLAKAEFRIPVKHMGWKNFPGKEVAEKILEAQRFAELDQYRATTHNKGIMNGIDAVALALG
jgi:degradative hydroxymethylglutaryl-CoA reductase